MNRIAIFASGRGSNARRIIEHFVDQTDIEVSMVLSNRADAPALEMAKEFGIPAEHIERKDFYQRDKWLHRLRKEQIDWVALAGFLWLVPQNLVSEFRGRILNIHPALLPSYGGKGMYGIHVHRAVKDAGDKESGMTIHQVNEIYDSGDIIFQARCPIDPDDEPEDIAAKVLKLEHRYYPLVLEQMIRQNMKH